MNLATGPAAYTYSMVVSNDVFTTKCPSNFNADCKIAKNINPKNLSSLNVNGN